MIEKERHFILFQRPHILVCLSIFNDWYRRWDTKSYGIWTKSFFCMYQRKEPDWTLTFLSHADVLAHSDVFAPGLLDYPSISVVFPFPHLLQQEQLKIDIIILIYHSHHCWISTKYFRISKCNQKMSKATLRSVSIHFFSCVTNDKLYSLRTTYSIVSYANYIRLFIHPNLSNIPHSLVN